MNSFKALIKLPNGTTTWVHYNSDNMGTAEQQAYSLYGRENVLTVFSA